MNFMEVGNLLSQRAKLLSNEYDERHDAKTVSQIKQFTSKLKRLQVSCGSFFLFLFL